MTGDAKDGAVKIRIADMRWEQIANVFGNWADWTDQKVVYEGDYERDRIERTITRAFDDWYARVTSSNIRS
ncbi:MAG: hypothetical protein K6T83_16725 [Alicyclobacillus sp.]|nr:hypothetical protein [Alicyclobacillus sp.]